MAVNMTLMVGRLGGVVGSNVTAILLDNYCEYAFYLPGCMAAGEFTPFLSRLFMYFRGKRERERTRESAREREKGVLSLKYFQLREMENSNGFIPNL